ncbi:class I SAM-dependent methyltransferase [Nitrospiraceae bacterium AH_259_D15_M11_P09]|nr:class I SAM-dependent methyltransferase [Nitrospiraceae bacterium AH_259_D15_M11_P09]
MRCSSMRAALITRSFLPFAARFLYRHPTKLGRFRRHWSDYVGRFGKVAELTGAEVASVEATFYELEFQEPLFQELNGLTSVPMHPIVYYTLVRLMQPDLVVETGVYDGMFSTRFLLLAMERNNRGLLHSIDFPNQDVEIELDSITTRQRAPLPPGREPGWLVPASLRGRWRLHLGDARELLPALLGEIEPPDIFIHDSLHSYDHMLFEYRTAWPCLRLEGILLSDDTNFNTAFMDFSAMVRCPRVMFDYRVGALRKPGHMARASSPNRKCWP